MKKKLTVCVVTVVFMLIYSSTIMAEEISLEQRVSKLENILGEWDFYGMVLLTAMNNATDEDAGDDSDTGIDMLADSRIGAIVKQDKLTSRFELGIDDYGEWGVYTRILFCSYDFDKFQLGIGQDETPVSGMFYSLQSYNGQGYLHCMIDLGQAYNGRRPMIRLSKGGLQVALVKQHGATDLGTGGDVDKSFPKIEARYHLQKDNYFADIYGGYQTYSIEGNTKDYDVDAYVVGIGGGVTLGSAYLRAGVHTGKNIGQYGLYSTGVSGAVIGADNELKENSTIAGLAVAGYQMNAKLGFETAVGYQSHDLDDAEEKDETMAYYIAANYYVSPSFIITPEVGVVDFMDDNAGTSEGKETYCGLRFWLMF